MQLTEQDLFAIDKIFEKNLLPVKRELIILRADVEELGVLKTDVAALKADVATLKTDVAALKTDVATLKTDVATLKTDVADLKNDMVAVKADIEVVKTDVEELKSKISLMQYDLGILANLNQLDLVKKEPRLMSIYRPDKPHPEK